MGIAQIAAMGKLLSNVIVTAVLIYSLAFLLVSDLIILPSFVYHVEDAPSNYRQKCDLNLTVKNICGYCLPRWIEEGHKNVGLFSTPAWTLWKLMEDKVRQAARDSLKDCWTEEGALKDLNETEFHNMTGRIFAELNSYR